MFYARDWAQPWARCYIVVALTLTLAQWTQALSITYCSNQNYALNQPLSSNYMSNGLCQDNCNKSNYVFAVLQGKDCWCSNYAPSDQEDTGKCNSPCPGYPSDTCGNVAQGLYAYFSLGGTPSGTSGGSSPSSRTSSSSVGRSSSSSSSLRSSSSTSSSTTTSTTPEPTQVYTSVVSVTGRVSTILVTPTSAPAQTSDSAIGSSQQSSGVSGGTVAGIVVGVAIVIGLIIGAAVFFWLRKRHRKSLDALSEGGSYTSPSQTGKSAGGIPSRQVSQMSSAGLLAKPSRSNTAGFSSVDDQRSAKANTLGSDRNSTHMTVDQRLNPWAIYSNDDSRASNVSLQDNQDYSRQLRVANPDP